MEVLDGSLDAACDHHGSRLSANFPRSNNLLVKVIHHDLGLEPDRVVVAFHVMPQFLFRSLGVELRVFVSLFDQPAVGRSQDVLCLKSHYKRVQSGIMAQLCSMEIT